MVLYTNSCIFFENRVYFSAVNCNGLFCSMDDMQPRLIAVFDKDPVGKEFLHSKVILYKKSIWCIPNNSRYLYEYDILNDRLDSYLVIENITTANCSYFMDAKENNGKLFLYPCRYEYLCVFDLEEKKIIQSKDIKSKWNNGCEIRVLKGGELYNNNVYVSSAIEDKFEIFDSELNCKKSVHLSERYGGITIMKVVKEGVIIVGRNGAIGFYNHDGILVDYKQNCTQEGIYKYFDMCVKDGEVYLVENDKNKILIYDYILGNINEIEYPICATKEFKTFWGFSLFIQLCYQGILFQSAYDGNVYKIENSRLINLGKWEWNICELDRERMKYPENDKCNFEMYENDIVQFIRYLVKDRI